MVKKIFVIIVLCIGGLLTYAALLPREMLVSREISIEASPDFLFPYINNSQKANEWMPWKDSDPDVVMSYTGPSEGVGSKSSWESKGQMGVGEALVIESKANSLVKTQLTYTKPFQMHQQAEISLSASGNITKVKWSVSGHKGFIFRLMGVFFNCDQMIGTEFEKGLLKLKSLSELK